MTGRRGGRVLTGRRGRPDAFAGWAKTRRAGGLALDRRRLMAGSSAFALAIVLGACDQPAPGPGTGEPWSDGTFFDDGFGWVD